MYKKDYHPDENIIFKTENYNFDAPKSTPLEPLSNALVQIDAALKKEESERIAEDMRINGRVDKEIADRENGDRDIRAMLKYYYIHNTTPYTGNYGGYEHYIFQFIQIGNSINFTLIINCHGVFDLTLADLFISGTLDSRFPERTKVAHDYVDEQNNASINIYPNSSAIQVNTSATTNVTFCLNGSFTINVV